MRITIGEETRETTVLEFISTCNRRGVTIKRDWFRLSCDDNRAQAILNASPELEAAVLTEMAAEDIEVRDALKERIAILWAERLPHSAMDAARAMIGR